MEKDCGCPLHDSEEAESSYWTYQPILLILDDGTAICPMSDDEGNEAGSIACMERRLKSKPFL